jgi:hypothetical protein
MVQYIYNTYIHTNIRTSNVTYRTSDEDGIRIVLPIGAPDLLRGGGKTFQNRNVSSPAPVTTV